MIGTAQDLSRAPRRSAAANLDPEQAADRRALSRFAEHIALTGVSIKEGKRVIYSGWDRKRGRRVRVIVEELED